MISEGAQYTVRVRTIVAMNSSMITQNFGTMRLFLSTLLLPFVVLSATVAQTGDTIRVCTYNLLQFDGDDVDRALHFRTILEEILPNVLVVQEISSDDPTEGFELFQDSVERRLSVPLTGYFVPDPESDSQIGVFVDRTKLRVVGVVNNNRSDAARSTKFITLVVRATSDSMVIVGSDMEEGETGDDREKRRADAEAIAFTGHQIFTGEFSVRYPDILLAGSLNMYAASEPAYQKLTVPSDDGLSLQFYDPLSRPGEWSNNPEFADLHTQSTRARRVGEGSVGGLNQRFDQILVNENLLDRVVPGSLKVYGNDGNHFNDSINAQPNSAVSPEIAQALHDASDHLPIFIDLVFGLVSSVEETDLTPSELDLTQRQ